MKNVEIIQEIAFYTVVARMVWYALAIIFFLIAIFTLKEVFTLLALVSAMMSKG